MGKTLFIGDSHTCGYTSIPGKIGQGSFETWQDNNYAEIYAKENNKETIVYSMPGSCNIVYADWLNAMFEKHPDIDEVFLMLSSFNRFILAYDKLLRSDTVPSDEFTHDSGKDDSGLVQRYQDLIISDSERLQLFQKPTEEDYTKFPGVKFSYDNGLESPNIRESSFMEIKMFFDLNTHVEQKAFFKDIYIWDNMCNDHGAKLFLFSMTDRLKFPLDLEFYGKLKSTYYEKESVETFFRKKNIDHTKYYISDQEHYNKEYHTLIATKFISSLKRKFAWQNLNNNV